MREIKFRAYIMHTEMILEVERINFNKMTLEVDETCGCGDYTEYKFDEVELMQYTGLKDKSGKEIYEGDILESIHSGQRQLVRLRDELVDALETTEMVIVMVGFGFIEPNSDELEIIGNKHENPELLNEK